MTKASRSRKDEARVQLRMDIISSAGSIKNTLHTWQSAHSHTPWAFHITTKTNKQGCKQPSSDGSTEPIQSSSKTWDFFHFPRISQSLELLHSMEHEWYIDGYITFWQLPSQAKRELLLNWTREPLCHREGEVLSPNPLSLKKKIYSSIYLREVLRLN